MPIPQHILSVDRPKNTVVIAYGKDKNLYAVRQRIGCRNVDGRHLPVNGIPFVTLVSEENRIGAYISSDYYEMFNVDPDKANWREGQGKKQKIRIMCDGKRIDVFVGESATPLASSKKFAYAFRRAPKYGFLRFHGDNVRVSDIIVRLPRNEPLP